MSHSTESQTLGDAINARGDFLPLSRAAMHEVGEAAQTLGAVYVLAGGNRGGQMYEPLYVISQKGVLPRRTVEAQIAKLLVGGWLDSHGRELLPGSKHRRRRTVTLKLTRKAIEKKEPFAMLPRWAATSLANERGGSWAERSVFACLVSAATLVESSELAEHGCLDGRQYRSLTTLRKETGLTWPSIRAARHTLERGGLVTVCQSQWNGATELALDPDCILTNTDVAKPVTRKSRPRGGREPRKNTKKKPAPSPEKSCADPLKNPAHTPEKSCALPVKEPAHPAEKSCAPHDIEPLVRTLGKNSEQEPLARTLVRNAAVAATDHLHFCVDVSRDARCAEHAFRVIGYTGTDGGFIWRAACWVNTGAITEAQFGDACQGTQVIEPANAVAYFRAILKETLGEARLTDLERRTSLPPGFVSGPSATFLDEERERRERGQRESEQSRRCEPERMSSAVERAAKRLTQMSADELAERKADFKRELEATKKGKAGAA